MRREQPRDRDERADESAQQSQEFAPGGTLGEHRRDLRWYLAVDEVSGWKVITSEGWPIARGLHYRNATLIARTHNQALTDV